MPTDMPWVVETCSDVAFHPGNSLSTDAADTVLFLFCEPAAIEK